jgi:ADP-ribose pyrophosphatase
MSRKIVVHEQRLILDDFFRIEEARLQFERYDGSLSPEVRRLSFDRGDCVGVLLTHRTRETVILTEQFRYPSHTRGAGWLVEVVAGAVDLGEDPAEAARRETLEETGYRVENVTLITVFFPSPGGSTERVFLFHAEVEDTDRVERGGGVDHEDEDIRVIEWSREEILERLEKGEVLDGKTLIALLWLRDKWRSQG